MTTRRNNMFYDRGFYSGISLALQAIQEYSDINKVKECLLKFKDARAKWITDCTPGFTRSTIETKSLITNYYFVTVKDNQYIITEKPAYNLTYRNKFGEWIYWSEDTSTQCVVTLYGDDSVIEFTDNDMNFHDNITNLIGISKDWKIIDRPMIIETTDDWRYDIYD